MFKDVNRNVLCTQVNWQTVPPHSWTVDRETTISIICPCPRNIHMVQVGGSKARTARTVRRRMTESHEVWWCQTVGALEDKQCCLEIYPLSDWQPVQTCRTGFMCSNFLVPVMSRAAAFCIISFICSLCSSWLLIPAKRNDMRGFLGNLQDMVQDEVG